MVSAFHNRRWDGDFLTLQSLITSGELGRVVSFESHFDRFRAAPRLGAWRESGGPGGGILFDLGPHLIDQALVLFGPPDSLWAEVRTERPGGVTDDAFDLHLHYTGGPSVWLRSTMSTVTPGARFSVHGTELDRGASFLKWGLDPQEDALKAGDTFATPNFGHEPEEAWGILARSDASPRRIRTEPGDYRRYYAGVREAILEHKAPPVTAREAWMVLWLIELARESSASGRTVPVDFG
jgi:predicted dehydrogenase